jgi:hypothetical protein
MPSKKSAPRWHAPELLVAPEVAAQPCTEENAAALSAAPIAVAAEWPVEAAPTQRTTGHKRSRVHEVFTRDPNDTDYCICQLTEGVKGGRVCGGRIKGTSSTKPLWNHVETFHPLKHKQLKGGDDDVDGVPSTAANSLASLTSVEVNISYQQMVDALCSAPQDVLADAIDALQQARDRRS